MVVTTGKRTHLQTSMPAEYVKELQDEELHSLGVHMLATRPNGEDTMATVRSVWVLLGADLRVVNRYHSYPGSLPWSGVSWTAKPFLNRGTCLECADRSPIWTSRS